MIIKPETKKLLQELGRHQHGYALKTYLNDALKELNDVRKIESWEETKGRQFAIKVIEDLFNFMADTKEQKKQGNQYV